MLDSMNGSSNDVIVRCSKLLPSKQSESYLQNIHPLNKLKNLFLWIICRGLPTFFTVTTLRNIAWSYVYMRCIYWNIWKNTPYDEPSMWFCTNPHSLSNCNDDKCAWFDCAIFTLVYQQFLADAEDLWPLYSSGLFHRYGNSNTQSVCSFRGIYCMKHQHFVGDVKSLDH